MFSRFPIYLTISFMMSLMMLGGCAHQPASDSGSQQAEIDSSVISYETEADKLQAKMAKAIKEHASEQDVAVMKQASKELAKAMPKPGLAVGEEAPEFTLPNALGKNVTLSEELEKGPVALVFYRGAWCPFCNLHLHSLRSIAPQLEQLNAQVIAITPQKPDASQLELKEKGYPFKVLSDTDYSVIKAYNVYFDLSPELIGVYKKFDIDLEESNGPGRTGLPIPATVIIDQKGIIRAMEADTDYKKRMEPSDVLNVVRFISDKSNPLSGGKRCPKRSGDCQKKKCKMSYYERWLDLSDEQKEQISAIQKEAKEGKNGKCKKSSYKKEKCKKEKCKKEKCKKEKCKKEKCKKKGLYKKIMMLDPTSGDYKDQIEEMAKNSAERAADKVRQQAKLHAKIYEVLTPDQRAVLRKKADERHQRQGEHKKRCKGK